MKYIISENRVDDIILKYIESTYPVDEINYTEGHDYDGNFDDSSYEFYYGDYDDGEETVFRWYGKNYWHGGDTELLRHRIEQSPLLSFDDSREIEKLNNLFGNKWKPVFIEWFYRNFSLRIKTVI
jgi:hypothetical protein